MLRGYLKWTKQQGAVSILSLLLLLLCGCSSSQTYQEPSSTPENKRKTTVEIPQVTTHKDEAEPTALHNSNIPVVHNPTPNQVGEDLLQRTNSAREDRLRDSEVSQPVYGQDTSFHGAVRSSSTPENSRKTTVATSQVTTDKDKVEPTALHNSNIPVVHNPTPNQVGEGLLQRTNSAREDRLRDSEVSRTVYGQDTSFHGAVKSSSHTDSAPLATKCNEVITQSDVVESIASLIGRCSELGQQNAAATTGPDAVAILGKTGTGKSTSVNYWAGCNMMLITPEELEEMGIEGELEDVIIVDPHSERPGVASIGHGGISHTLMPQIIQDPSRATRVYLDCPGFSDNRGAGINIANAMNIKHALQQASGVKAVFLASYQDLIGNRGECIRYLDNMCEQLFGGIANLRQHQSSVLLGINRVAQQATLSGIRTRLTQWDSPIIQILAQRTFLYDPLERGRADFWSRDRFLTEIDQIPAIPQRLAKDLFQTVLTSDDKVMLQCIVENQVDAMRCALAQCDYSAAGCCWRLLNRLRIIEHEEIERRINRQARPHLRVHATERMDVFREHVVQRDFTEAARLQALLCSLQTHFPDENLVVLESLEATLQTAQEQYNAQQEAEKQVEEERKNAEEARKNAEEAQQRTEEAQQRTEEARKNAEEARKNAEEARKNAAKQQQKVEQERKNAEEARENAAEQQQRAERLRKETRIVAEELKRVRIEREAMEKRARILQKELEEVRRKKKH
jgi:hypothetical protein